MRIEGLKASGKHKVGTAARIDFVPAVDVPLKGIIRLTVRDDGAVAELLDKSGNRHGIEDTEIVPINTVDDDVFTRMVRALASMHLGVEEAETNCTEADIAMIAAGFGIGRMPDGSPAWMKADDGFTYIVIRTDKPGLPPHRSSPCLAMAVAKNGRKITFEAMELETAIMAINGGTLRNAFNPLADVLIKENRIGRNTVH